MVCLEVSVNEVLPVIRLLPFVRRDGLVDGFTKPGAHNPARDVFHQVGLYFTIFVNS